MRLLAFWRGRTGPTEPWLEVIGTLTKQVSSAVRMLQPSTARAAPSGEVFRRRRTPPSGLPRFGTR